MIQYIFIILLILSIPLGANPHKCILKKEYTPFSIPDEKGNENRIALPPGLTFDGYLIENWIFGFPWFYKKDYVFCNLLSNKSKWIFTFAFKLHNNEVSKSIEISKSIENEISFLNAKSDRNLLLWSVKAHDDLWNFIAIDDINNDGVDDFLIVTGWGDMFSKYYFMRSEKYNYTTILLLETSEKILDEPFGVKELSGSVLREFSFNYKTKNIQILSEALKDDHSIIKKFTLKWNNKLKSWQHYQNNF